ncbi:uncharacterized protein LOC128956509 [Oppia nitens]|uniref:uncharacterized protein LOC128956509 n=1 Tax=Oppia nitens TaxID=1686743 RepID=UPI0023DA7565|nr:uncharacterized protein LOC128956509 [Oppia nitens]
MDNKSEFIGKVVVITGGSTGSIGAGIATEFAKRGAQVVISGPVADRIKSVANRCTDVSPNGLLAAEIVADISREDDCKSLIDTTVDLFNKIDILVNIFCEPLASHVMDTDFMDQLNNMLDIQLKAPIWLTQLSANYLDKSKGNIVFVNTLSSLHCDQDHVAHSTVQYALNVYSKCAARSLMAQGVRINTVVTNLSNDSTGSSSSSSGDTDVVGTPEDVALAVLYLSSPAAKFINGTTHVVDGGHNIIDYYLEN